MNIENINSFIAVYQHGSFQKAAEALYITQPSLSSRIKSLENGLGTSLLIRNKTGVSLTRDGQTFLPYALQIVDNYKKAVQELSHPARTINIGSITSLSQTVLPRVLSALHKDYPYIVPNIVTGTSADMTENVRSDKCSFAVRQASPDDGFAHIPIYEDPVLFVVSPDHHMAKSDRIYPLKEIFYEPLIRFEPKIDYWKKLEDYAASCGAKMHVEYHTNRSYTVSAMIKENIGGSFLPELLVHEDLANGKLRCVRFEPNLHLFRTIECIYPIGPEPEFMALFIQMLQNALRGGSAIH